MAFEPNSTDEAVDIPCNPGRPASPGAAESVAIVSGTVDISRIRRIVASDPVAVDPFARLQTMWVYQFYKRHLQKHGWIRQVVRGLWGAGYAFYRHYAARRLSATWRNAPWRPFVRYSDYVRQIKTEQVLLATGNVVDTPAPRVLPQREQGYLVAPHASYSFPDVTVAVVESALVSGGSNMVLVDGQIICHDLYDFDRDYTSEELHGRMLVDVPRRRAKLRNQKVVESVAEAAAFVDACAANYAHWMTELLPRIAVFCAQERYQGIPLIINDGLHPNILASLFQVAGAEREIIALANGCALRVARLHVTSPAGYVPFERRRGAPRDGHSHGIFSSHAFAAIRHAVLGGNADGMPSRKIYLRRNSGIRQVKNADVIEAALTKQGFEVVEPEKLTFLQQAEIFSSAAIIVGSTGAAFANLLFAHPQARIYIMISKQPDTSYWYWQNMARAVGNRVIYMLGEPEGAGGIHADFRVDFDEVLANVGGTL